MCCGARPSPGPASSSTEHRSPACLRPLRVERREDLRREVDLGVDRVVVRDDRDAGPGDLAVVLEDGALVGAVGERTAAMVARTQGAAGESEQRLAALVTLSAVLLSLLPLSSSAPRRAPRVPDDVVFVDAIPLGATGKMQKNKLREQFKSYKLPSA